MVIFSKIRNLARYVPSVFWTSIWSMVSKSRRKILWLTLSLLFPKSRFKSTPAGVMLPLFNLLLYVFLGPFSPRANGNETMSSLFSGSPYGARLQSWHHSRIMCLVSVFTRLINTQNMPCNTICCLFYPKLLQHVFTWSFSLKLTDWSACSSAL
jgi:hypothetical protein